MNPISSRIVTAPEPGGPEKLVVRQVDLAPPAAGEVLIDVAASGINRPDVFERMGFYPAPDGAPEGLGLEVSGTVRAIGEGVTAFQVGDPVVALVSGGGYADVARAKAGSVLPAPKGVDLVEAAGLPRAEARSTLRRLASEAESRGWGLVAREASAAAEAAR